LFIIVIECRQRYPQLTLTISNTSSYGSVNTRNRESPACPERKAFFQRREKGRAQVHAIGWFVVLGKSVVVLGAVVVVDLDVRFVLFGFTATKMYIFYYSLCQILYSRYAAVITTQA
jgi:hypothetical protein